MHPLRKLSTPPLRRILPVPVQSVTTVTVDVVVRFPRTNVRSLMAASRWALCSFLRSIETCVAVRLRADPAENDTSRQCVCPLTRLHLTSSLATRAVIRPSYSDKLTYVVVNSDCPCDRWTFERQTAITYTLLNRL